MSGQTLKKKRSAAGIAGEILCARVGMDRARLSRIERGYLQPSTEEWERLTTALEELAEIKRQLNELASQRGWPGEAF